jgi:hypothetical protein
MDAAMGIPSRRSAFAGSGLRFHARIFHPNECKRRVKRLPMRPKPINPSLSVLLLSVVAGIALSLLFPFFHYAQVWPIQSPRAIAVMFD